MRRSILLLVFLIASTAWADSGKESEWIATAYHRSLLNEGLQKYDDAIKAILPVQRKFPNTYTVNLRLGWLNYLAGHYANAIAAYRKAIKAMPDAAEPRLGLMLPLLAQKKYTEVEAIATKILHTDLFNYLANLRLMIALSAQHKFEAARSVGHRMLALYPADTTFLQALASTEAAAGNTQKAISLYYAVYTLDPNNVTARRYLKLDGEQR